MHRCIAYLRRYPDRVQRGFLCHSCGCSEFEQIDDSHFRCVECGHGGTSTRLTAVADPNPSPAKLAAAEEQMRWHDRKTAAAFGGAPFFPYALDDRWTGLRSFAGYGKSGDTVTTLSLAFGDSPLDDDAAAVRVRTELPDRRGAIDGRMAAFVLARQQVQHLWRQTGVLRPDIRRAIFPLDGDRRHDPTGLWDRAVITADGESIEFAILREHEHWVAQATIEPLVVGIESRHWPIEAVGLHAETRFDAYAAGAAQLRRKYRTE
jgi:hypothetical protein